MNSLGTSPLGLLSNYYLRQLNKLKNNNNKKSTIFLLVFGLSKLIEAVSGGGRAYPGCIDPEACLPALASPWP